QRAHGHTWMFSSAAHNGAKQRKDRFLLTTTTRERLALLATHVLARVTDAFALVRLRRTDLANVCRELADQVLVRAGNGELGRIGFTASGGDFDRHGESLGNLD